MHYSIAIRTLGNAGDKFQRELESIKRQSLQPDKVLVFIAEGYERPSFQIGKEEYRWVKKGMMAQRLLPYDDIDSDLILFLDDDVELAPDSAEKLIKTLADNRLDAIGSDIFQNHKMPLKAKLYAAIVNLVTPHFNNNWAFKIKKNGAFSYNNNPTKDWLPSQSCGGPAWMIRKSVYNKLRFQDELWLDSFGFAYGEDQLETYKIYKNGFKLGVLYDSGIKNLDAKTDSQNYLNNKNRIYIRTKASFAIWWRINKPPSFPPKGGGLREGGAVFLKLLWSFIPISIYSLKTLSLSPLKQFVKGNIDGWKFVHSPEFQNLPTYVTS